jgi:N-formylglutamate amidohydrolase
MELLWNSHKGNGPLVATAIHDGHELREDVREHMLIREDERLREEDPFTGLWTEVASTQVVARFSRFQVDLNRPREKAVYLKPEDAWGLHVWKIQPSAELVARSLQEYDAFYDEMQRLLSGLAEQNGLFLVLDLHTYNHRRDGRTGKPADPAKNPEVNIGTGTMSTEKWRPIVDRFMGDLSSFDFLGRRLDVRENVKFRGGRLSRWVHETFPTSGCALAIEFK